MKGDKITINIGVRIPDETAERCCRILEMYLNDNPDVIIQGEKEATLNGFRTIIRMIRRGEMES